MKDFKIFYDEEEDILYLAKEGQEGEVVELSPGINLELDESGKLIGVEVFKASSLFKDVIKSTHSTPRSEAQGMLRVDTERRFLPRFKNRGLAPSNVSKNTAEG